MNIELDMKICIMCTPIIIQQWFNSPIEMVSICWVIMLPSLPLRMNMISFTPVDNRSGLAVSMVIGVPIPVEPV